MATKGGRPRRSAGWSTDQQSIVPRVFVYGTLRSGQAARSLIAHYVADARPARASGRIYALPDGYPGLVPGPDGEVVGEILELRELAATFALLDAYEGDDFLRTLDEVRLAGGEPVWTWLYVLATPRLAEEGQLIPSGDWARFASE